MVSKLIEGIYDEDAAPRPPANPEDMKPKAFILAGSTNVVLSQPANAPGCGPTLTIMGYCPALMIVGRDAILSLVEACNHSLNHTPPEA